ncbi:MAG: metallophosphoesterase family protein [Candidatus Methanomethylophilaceae archaeon]
MRFLVISDLHQKKSALGWINRNIADYKTDAVLFLGDVTNFGTYEDAIDILKGIKSDVYFVPGNCDPVDISDKVSGVVHSVHGKSFELGGIYFACLGGSNPTIFDTPFELSEEEIKTKLAPISRKGMVLMTHAPSYGILDEIPSGANVGSTAIRGIVDEFHPIVALSGHIHEETGIKKINGTLFMNPGPAKDGYSAILTIENGIAKAELIEPRIDIP